MKYLMFFENFEEHSILFNEIKLRKFIESIKTSDQDVETIFQNLKSKIEEYQSLPQIVTLYRLIAAPNKDTIRTDNLGKHYFLHPSNITDDFLNSISISRHEKIFLVEIQISKNKINFDRTIQQNIIFPNEDEIFTSEFVTQSNIKSISEIMTK